MAKAQYFFIVFSARLALETILYVAPGIGFMCEPQ